MAKLTTMVNGQSTEVEIGEDELINSIKGETGIMQKVRTLLGLDKADSQKPIDQVQSQTETKAVSSETGNVTKQIGADVNSDRIKALEEQISQFNKEKIERANRARETKVRKLAEQAVTEGKIATGQIETLVKKYKEFPSSVLSDYLSAIKPDPAIKKTNSQTQTSGDKAQNAGVKVFKESEIAKMSDSEYRAQEKDILTAMAQGNIID